MLGLAFSAALLSVALVLPIPTVAVGTGGSSRQPAGPAKTYERCQRKTCRPTDGCPPGTIYVSQNDTRAAFTSIQAAIDSLGNSSAPAHILIAPGNYTEQLNVTRSGPLTLIGMSTRPWKGQAYADIDVNATAANDVQVWWNSANHDAIFTDNVFTGVLTVGPTLNATLTGSGPTGFPVPADTPFGCSDFRAYNIDFRNEFAPYSDGPAHAVGVSRANAGFYSCGLYSWQDTLYVGKLGNAYFYDTIIAGQTDFLYGFGTAYIEKSTLSLRSCGGGITAWKGTNTTFDNKYGVYIDKTQLIAANYTIAQKIKGQCALGRPWNAQHRSVFMDSYFDASIKPAGYIQWGSTDPRVNNYTFMATWDDYGPGYNETAERLSNGVTLVLTDEQVAAYRYPVDVFQSPDGSPGNVGWIDQSVLVG
ncbi:pectinesterase [Diplogelasinospora grovesii]|uniref:pectinesterase n=1 Tax=Diplogelasinospora grovesii TaxID=303347 RepID=A0AAN6NCY8_9PEZI|nr:pectinesterase [Diplogelasinospora grovesii]